MTIKQSSPVRTISAKRRWSRRGLSLVEVVMASMLLAVIASAVVGGITTVVAADSRGQQKLEALELANRLLLQYLDDKEAMPDQETHLTQGRGVYRWVMRTSPVQLTTPEQSVIDRPIEGASGNALNKLRLLAVSVYSGIPDGAGGYTYGERVCTLSRVYHPLSTIYRNPDKMIRITNDPEALIRLFSEFMETGEPLAQSPAAISPPRSEVAHSTATPVTNTPKPTGSDGLFSGTRSSTARLQ